MCLRVKRPSTISSTAWTCPFFLDIRENVTEPRLQREGASFHTRPCKLWKLKHTCIYIYTYIVANVSELIAPTSTEVTARTILQGKHRRITKGIKHGSRQTIYPLVPLSYVTYCYSSGESFSLSFSLFVQEHSTHIKEGGGGQRTMRAFLRPNKWICPVFEIRG